MLIRGPFTVTPSGDKDKDIRVITQKINDEFEKIEHVELNDLPEVKDINIPFLFK